MFISPDNDSAFAEDDTPGRSKAMFVADYAALDFLNSIRAPGPTQVEWLANGEDLLSWMQEASLLTQAEAVQIRSASPPLELDEVAHKARNLREWFRAFATKHMGQRMTAEALTELSVLNDLLPGVATFSEVVSVEAGNGSAGLAMKRLRAWTSPDNLLSLLAEEVAKAICESRFSLIKKCESSNCTMLFHDTTKGHARRWCSMSLCGNRAKQAAMRARRRGR